MAGFSKLSCNVVLVKKFLLMDVRHTSFGEGGAGVSQSHSQTANSPDRQPASEVMFPNHKTNTSSNTALFDISIHATPESI